MSVEKTPLLLSSEGEEAPPVPFATALCNPQSGLKLPQTIAHRGYKAAYPENTLAAFRAAVDVGAHALETDIHLSKDKVVVLSHDATLKRCFGREDRIADCDWSYLSTLETVSEPKQHMPSLVDLLEYLTQPGNEDIWVLLDLKKDDDPHELLTHTAAAISSVKPSPSRPWKDRIILGPWDETYIALCTHLLPGFPLAYIGWSVRQASKILHSPAAPASTGFNIRLYSLLGPGGARFLRAARQARRALLVWTVNREVWMEWSIRQGVDGVITDDPKLFLEVCARWERMDDRTRRAEMAAAARSPRQLVREAVVMVFMVLVLPLVWLRVRRLAGKRRRDGGKLQGL